MILLIRAASISGVMCGARRNTVVGALATLAMAALIGDLGPAALAQGGPTQAIAADLLFTGPDSVDFRPGAGFGVNRLVTIVQQVQQAQTPGSQCPTDVDFTVMRGLGDFLFTDALALARLDAIKTVLEGFGPSVRINGQVTEGLVKMVFIGVQTAKDKEKPKLMTTSQPSKGTKVLPGDLIKVTMIARDDANKFQSGIKEVTLVAEGEGNALIAESTYPPSPPGCTDVPREREVRGTYTVPADPPPVVRLVATAVDHVGLIDTDIGEFPTGDWYGTFMMHTGTLTPSTSRMRADIGLNHDGKGNLTGTMVGEHQLINYTLGGCSHRTIQPGRFRVALVGSYTQGRAFKVFIKEIEETINKVEMSCDGRPPSSREAPFKQMWFPEAFLGTPSPLGEGEILADGTRQYKWVGEGSGATATVMLRRARD